MGEQKGRRGESRRGGLGRSGGKSLLYEGLAEAGGSTGWSREVLGIWGILEGGWTGSLHRHLDMKCTGAFPHSGS